MNAAIEKVLYHLTQKNNLTEVSVDTLLFLINEYPFFAPAQLTLALKLKQDKSLQYDVQIKKTTLYFSNQNWLAYQLLDDEASNFKIEDANNQLSPTISTPTVETISPNVEEIKAFSEVERYKNYFPPTQEIPTIEAVKNLLQNIEIKEEEIENTNTLSATKSTNLSEQKNTTPSSIDITLPTYPEVIIGNPFLSPFQKNIEKNILEKEEKQMEKYTSLLANQLSNFKKPVEENAKLDFEMEPFYTIDYFASQGIKADLTQQPQDKLTKQLLTFTDWLKKMKTVSTNPQDLGTDPELEKAIQGIAQTSNEAKEIATETMAEIFVKQGKIDKAVQLYIKLSFLDPEKSSYFAAKIQQLKGI